MSTRIRGPRTASRWIALFAILVVTFAPSISGWLSAARGQPWDQVCSATSSPIARKATTGDGSPTAPHAFEHCPYCALHADLAPPPDAQQAGAASVFAFRAQPVAFLRAPRASATWASAQPRAPPSRA